MESDSLVLAQQINQDQSEVSSELRFSNTPSYSVPSHPNTSWWYLRVFGTFSGGSRMTSGVGCFCSVLR